MFVAEAVETLSRMEHTCALDYVDAKGHGELQLARDVGEALGVTKQQVLRDIGQAQASARAALESADIDGTSIHRVEGEHTHRSRRGGAE